SAPDPFTSSSSAIKKGTRMKAVGGNTLLSRPPLVGGPKNRFTPYASKCKDCRQMMMQNGAKYCHGCVYKKGLCSICGKRILDTTGHQVPSKWPPLHLPQEWLANWRAHRVAGRITFLEVIYWVNP
ncbi:hypothetical protein BDM02DRAFT_3097434, partial [Thelephora ganbajun]